MTSSSRSESTRWKDAVRRRSVRGAVVIRSAEGHGVVSPSGDARQLAREAAARALKLNGRRP